MTRKDVWEAYREEEQIRLAKAKAEEAKRKLRRSLLALALFPLVYALELFVVRDVWRLLLVPAGVPAIGWAAAFGFVLVARAACSADSSAPRVEGDPIIYTGRWALRLLTAWGFAALAAWLFV